MSRDEVTPFFMGREKDCPPASKHFRSTRMASGDKPKFYEELINKDLAEVNSYWAR